MVDRTFIGTWEATTCVLTSFARCTVTENDMVGIRFKLGENGDVTWCVPEGLRAVPLFCCEFYEYRSKTGSSTSRIDLRFGAYAGQIFEFKVYNLKPKDSFKLSSDQLCEMDCIYLEVTVEPTHNQPFSLLPALEDGYFSDVTLTASNKKQFHVHSTILRLLAYDIDWKQNHQQFDGMSEEVLGTILHFLYAECLPENLNENTARQVKDIAAKYPSLNKLMTVCDKFINKMQLRRQIITLVNDVHACMDRIVEHINPRGGFAQQDNVASNPAKLCFAIKQSFREEVVAIVKFVYLCDLYTKRKHELTVIEEENIMLLLKSKVPVYNIKFRQFLEGLKKIYRSMSPTQRIEVASFIVPEIEGILNTILLLMEDMNKLFQDVVKGFNTSGSSHIPFVAGENLSKRLTSMVRRMELRKLKSVQENINLLYDALIHKRDKYISMSNAERIQSLARNLELFIKELPIFLIRLDEIVDVFDEKLEIPEFKFFFKVETSKVAYVLQKLREHSSASQQFIIRACEFIQRDAFNETIRNLNLLKTPLPELTNPQKCTTSSGWPGRHGDQDYSLSLVKSLCVPPPSNESSLSARSLKLFNDQVNTDVEFEVVGSGGGLLGFKEFVDVSEPEENTVIKAHRVVVASRCIWFRRALLSGMKEAIDRKIIIHEADPHLFRVMLEFLYSGRLKYNSLSIEQVLELLLLSDRYEVDPLKRTCENFLRQHIDNETVLYFLSMADQYNAKVLKSRCFHYISQNNHITESEEFFQLPLPLQAEIFDTVSSLPGRYFYYGTTDEQEICGLQSNTSSQDDVSTGRSCTSRLERCITQLRSIVGEAAPRSDLIEVILAADYNLQRAINYYYARTTSNEHT